MLVVAASTVRDQCFEDVVAKSGWLLVKAIVSGRGRP